MSTFEVTPSQLTVSAATLQARSGQLQTVAARLSVLDKAEHPLVADGLALVREAWGTAATLLGESVSLVAGTLGGAARFYLATDAAIAGLVGGTDDESAGTAAGRSTGTAGAGSPGTGIAAA